MGANFVAKSRRFLRLARWGFVTAALAGCAGGALVSEQSSPEVVKKVVTERAEARWQALIRGDLAAAYEYLSPSSRAVMSLELYKGKHKTGMYRAAKVDSVACEGALCTVTLNVTYDVRRMKGVVTPVSEQWLISDGHAWYVEGV